MATLVGTRAAGDLSPQGTTQTHFKGEPVPPTSGGSFPELLGLPHLGKEPQVVYESLSQMFCLVIRTRALS